MIARIWRAWTPRANAETYEKLWRSEILPGMRRIAGFHGATLLRRSDDGLVEFITLTYFQSWDAVTRFAGEGVQKVVVPAKARPLLAKFDERCVHYATIFDFDSPRTTTSTPTWPA